jgi:hypothetical protein
VNTHTGSIKVCASMSDSERTHLLELYRQKVRGHRETEARCVCDCKGRRDRACSTQ